MQVVQDTCYPKFYTQGVLTLLQYTRPKVHVPSKYCILQEAKYTSRQECCSVQKLNYACHY